jgi:hypothetical protein
VGEKEQPSENFYYLNIKERKERKKTILAANSNITEHWFM